MKHRWLDSSAHDFTGAGYEEVENEAVDLPTDTAGSQYLVASRRRGSLRGGQGSPSLRSRALLQAALDSAGDEPPREDSHVVRWKIPSGLLATVAVALMLITVWSTVRGVLPGASETVAVSVPATTADTAGGESAAKPEENGTLPETLPASRAAEQSQSGDLTVHVDGAVAKPGVYTLPAGSRVNDAVEAAGGALPEAETGAVNLADRLTDGVQVYLPVSGQVQSAGISDAKPAGGAASSGSSGLVNINTASSEELQTLPKVGPVLAESIIAWRQEHGGFQNVEELDQVSGIGPATMENLRDLVTV